MPLLLPAQEKADAVVVGARVVLVVEDVDEILVEVGVTVVETRVDDMVEVGGVLVVEDVDEVVVEVGVTVVETVEGEDVVEVIVLLDDEVAVNQHKSMVIYCSVPNFEFGCKLLVKHWSDATHIFSKGSNTKLSGHFDNTGSESLDRHA